MKKFYILVLIGFIFSIAHGQIINLRWGGLNDGGDDFSDLFYVGLNKNDSMQMVTINNQGQVNLFDSSLNRVQHKELMKLLKGDAIIASCPDQKKWHLFTSATKGELYEAEFDNDAIGIKSTQLLYKFTANGTLHFSISPDSSKWAFYRIGMINKKQMLEVIVITSRIKTLYSQQIPLSANTETFSEIIINNKGAIAWVDNDAKNLLFSQIDENGSIQTPQIVAITAKKMHPAVGSVADDKFMFCVGYNRENINYDCFSVFEFAILSGTSIDHKLINIPSCQRDAVPMHCIAWQNNSAIIVTEEFANTTTASSNTCRYGSLHAICISVPEGKLLWQRDIFKNLQFVTTPDKKSSPSSPDYSSLYSHNLFIFGTKLMFTYNDNCSNCMRAQQTPRTHSEIRKSCLNLVALNENGELIRYNNLTEPQSKYTVHINNTFRINTKKIIVFGTNTRYMLGRLLLE